MRSPADRRVSIADALFLSGKTVDRRLSKIFAKINVPSRSAEDWLDAFRTYYRPIHKAFAALDDAGQVAFEHDLLALANELNSGGTGGLRVASEYVEVVAVRA